MDGQKQYQQCKHIWFKNQEGFYILIQNYFILPWAKNNPNKLILNYYNEQNKTSYGLISQIREQMLVPELYVFTLKFEIQQQPIKMD